MKLLQDVLGNSYQILRMVGKTPASISIQAYQSLDVFCIEADFSVWKAHAGDKSGAGQAGRSTARVPQDRVNVFGRE